MVNYKFSFVFRREFASLQSNNVTIAALARQDDNIKQFNASEVNSSIYDLHLTPKNWGWQLCSVANFFVEYNVAQP